MEEISSGYGMKKTMPVRARQTGIKLKKKKRLEQMLNRTSGSSLDIAVKCNLYKEINIASLTNAKHVMYLLKSSKLNALEWT